MFIRTIITCFSLLVFSTIFGQNNGGITGHLKDSISGEPLQYATVALFKTGSNDPLEGMVTDENGRFEFLGLDSSTYSIQASFLGYATKTIADIAVTADREAIDLGTVMLVPDVSQLEEVTVQSLRPTIIQKADRIVVNIEGTGGFFLCCIDNYIRSVFYFIP